MEATTEEPRGAWQPFTPRGVAAFARASYGRLLTLQLAVALLVSGGAVWFLQSQWFPVVGAAIDRLPPDGAMLSGWLDWRGNSPVTLAENRFLALVIDLDHAGKARSPAHLEVEFGRRDLMFFSLLGCRSQPYPASWTSAFNQTDLKPWWGAWAPALLAIAGVAVVVYLLGIWALLAVFYGLIAKLIARFRNRQLTLIGSWKLAGAALMPGALFLTVGLIFYGLGTLDVIQLTAVTLVHYLIPWVYLGLGAMSCPKRGADPAGPNPFAPAEAPAEAPPDPRPSKASENPFRASRD